VFIRTGVVEFARPILCKISVENGKFWEGVRSFVPACGTGDRGRQQTRQVCGSFWRLVRHQQQCAPKERKWLQDVIGILIALQPGARIP
jgi:hypothetical protein